MNLKYEFQTQNLTVLCEYWRIRQYIDYKNVSAEDVTSELLKNVLTEKRSRQSEALIKDVIHQNKTKKEDVLDAISSSNNYKEKEDDALLNTDFLNNQIQYSTVQLYIYQEPVFTSVAFADIPAITPYERPFFARLQQSFLIGFGWVKELVIFFSKFWAFAFVLLAVWLGIRITAIKWSGKTS